MGSSTTTPNYLRPHLPCRQVIQLDDTMAALRRAAEICADGYQPGSIERGLLDAFAQGAPWHTPAVIPRRVTPEAQAIAQVGSCVPWLAEYP